MPDVAVPGWAGQTLFLSTDSGEAVPSPGWEAGKVAPALYLEMKSFQAPGWTLAMSSTKQ